MIEKIKKISNKKIVITTLCLMLITLVLGFTYAYWTMNFTQSGVNTNTYDCFELTFSENVDGVTQTSGYPQTDAEGLTNSPYDVTITNTCNIAASYNVVLNKLNTSTLDDSHIKVAVDNNVKLLSEIESVNSTLENTTEAKIIKTGVLAGKTSKTISIRSWMEENTTQEEGSNKTFSYKITIEALATKANLLAEQILVNPLQTAEPDFAIGEPPASDTNTGSGLYQIKDDYGTSYYFRGAIDNNYVSFANQTWRVVRINGDGSIRLITNNNIGTSVFNTEYTNSKYVGYTYDNDHICTSSNPCTSETGTSSTIKTYLENWYKDNLEDYDNKIVQSIYCNDTSTMDYTNVYDRIKAGMPTLTCSNAEENFGGYYLLKVGLISADELSIAGFSSRNIIQENNYLYPTDNYWTGSPGKYKYNEARVIYTYYGVFDANLVNSTSYNGVRPVINLKADTIISSGNGTKDNPYVIE